MLELKDINKIYRIAHNEIYALKNISVRFREREMTAILGPSGCGKTTLLNIIGGLDRYSSGEMVIDECNTKEYSDKDWDTYRNHKIGFVFQNYNLIPHQTVLENVELAAIISGVKKQDRKKMAKEALEKVGLGTQLKKKPNQLSGGQMQRVAIARAIINDPDIILADEPTGALDTDTGCQIMRLLKEIASEKMVIVVTHNPELADKYSDRIIQINDGVIIEDIRLTPEKKQSTLLKKSNDKIKLLTRKKYSMSRIVAWKLSCSNLFSKKKRTFIINLACSVGITGIALIFSLSAGIQRYIEKMQTGNQENNYLMIDKERAEINDKMEEQEWEEYPDDVKEVYPYNDLENFEKNIIQISPEYLDYVEKKCTKLSSDILYRYNDNFHILCKRGDMYDVVPNNHWHEMLQNKESIEKQCEILAGDKFPTEFDEIAIVVDSCNRISTETLKELGINYNKEKGIGYDELIGREYRLILNDDYYKEEVVSEDKKVYNEIFSQSEKEEAYKHGIRLKVTCVIRGTKEVTGEWLSEGIMFTNNLAEMVRKNNAESKVVLAQKAIDSYSILDGQPFFGNTDSKEKILETMGYSEVPNEIFIYPKGVREKESILKILKNWNENHSENIVEYQDMAQIISDVLKLLIQIITYVLVAFCGITVVASSIMVAIIIYSSVIERTREIGILRALGASRRDVSRIFRTESALLGGLSGIIAIMVTGGICFLINVIIENTMDIERIAVIEGKMIVYVLLLSTIVTWLAGKIPAKLAAKKDPVIALRME